MRKLSPGYQAVILIAAGFFLLASPALLFLLLGKNFEDRITLIIITTLVLSGIGTVLAGTGIVKCVIYTVRLIRSNRDATPVDSNSKSRQTVVLQFMRQYPVRTFLMEFLCCLGAFHLSDDAFHYFLGWHIDSYHDYGMALWMAVFLAFVLPRLGLPLSDEERRAEKAILDQAEAIDRAARDAKTV